MKSKLYLIVSSIFFMLMTHQSFSQANTSLSNLASATAVNHSLVAGSNNSLSLGSSTIGWRNLYLTNGFYINNTLVFATPLKSNIAIGARALYLNTTTDHLIAIGDSAFYHNTSGARGTAVGSFALYNNTTGDNNTAFGYQSLYYNSTGSSNIAAGLQALYANTTGSNNIASGAKALYSNTTGYSNVAIGIKALYSNTTGNQSIAIGDSSMYNNTVYISQPGFLPTIAIGSKALYISTASTDNVAVGYNALYSNTGGGHNTAINYSLYNNTTGSFNVGVGNRALIGNSTGNENTGVGDEALYGNSTGTLNTGVGGNALDGNSTGNNNTGIGVSALDGNSTGSNNTALGFEADVNADGYTNATALGYYSRATASNQVMIGNSSVTAIEGYSNYYDISDGRVKKNIKENVPGLAFINALKPVTYNYDIHAANNKTGLTAMQQKTNADDKASSVKASATGITSATDKVNEDAINAKEKKIYTGFVAQDVEAAAKKLNYDFSGIHEPENDKDLYALSYSDFVVPLVKGEQELSKMNDAKTAGIDSLKSEISDLKSEVEELKAMIVSSANSQQSTVISSASLAQNVPNPFANATSISYSLPLNYALAQIIITDKKGVALKQISLNTKGSGSLSVDASTLAAGAYQYSLYVNGRLIDTKQMISAK